eukprot:4495618-Amphidinium_carterae.5
MQKSDDPPGTRQNASGRLVNEKGKYVRDPNRVLTSAREVKGQSLLRRLAMKKNDPDPQNKFQIQEMNDVKILLPILRFPILLTLMLLDLGCLERETLWKISQKLLNE